MITKITVGIAQDLVGAATRKYQIIGELTRIGQMESTEYLCQGMPIIMTNTHGRKYISSPMTGLFIRDKSEFAEVHDEILEV